MAAKDKERYKREMEVYNAKKKSGPSSSSSSSKPKKDDSSPSKGFKSKEYISEDEEEDSDA
jgi:hypothetical protein